MRYLGYLFIVVLTVSTAACTTVANPGPNSIVPECHAGEHLICSGNSGSRITKNRDPHSVCHCDTRIDR